MTRRRRPLVIVALLLIALAWRQVAAAQTGLLVRSFSRDGVPMLYLAPIGAKGAPAVLVAHGFAGSKQLMLGYGYTFAHAGYAVLLWDFGGHGANGQPLQSDSLQHDIDLAYAVLLEQPEVDGKRVALLGHSMGSGAVMSAGIKNPERYAAVVAISPTDANVTPAAPRNLLLQGGSWEGQFVANAERLLASAGGSNADLAGGRARRLTIIPNAEHITILFRNESHQAALAWVDAAFGRPTTSAYADRRILWYLLHLAAWMLLIVAIAPWVRGWSVGRFAKSPNKRSVGRLAKSPYAAWIGLALGPLIAGGVVAGLDRITPMATFGGIQVGGAVGLWLAVAGAVWLGVARSGDRPQLNDGDRPQLNDGDRPQLNDGDRPQLNDGDRPQLNDGDRPQQNETSALRSVSGKAGHAVSDRAVRLAVLGLALFVLLTAAFGVMAQGVWVQWWLIAPRLLRWPLLALLSLPWFLAAGKVQQGGRPRWRVAWWLGQSIALVGGLFLALLLVPSLGFLVLLMPLLPVILGILAIAAAAFDQPWAYGIGGAMFFGWVIAAVFPLAG